MSKLSKIFISLSMALFSIVAFIQLSHATVYYSDDFSGLWGDPVTGWRDELTDSGFNAYFLYAQNQTSGELIRNASSSFGKTLSPSQSLNFSNSVYLEFKVLSMSTSTQWAVGIQELEGSYQHWTLADNQTGTGVFYYDVKAATGWTSGTHVFSIEFITIGTNGKKVTYDYVQLMDTEPTATVTSTVTPTHTVTLTPTPTPTPTFTATSTVTATPMPYAWESIFAGTPGDNVTRWTTTNATFKYIAGNRAQILRVTTGDSLVRSPESVFSSYYNRARVVIDSVNASHNCTLNLQMRDSPWTNVRISKYTNMRALWDIDMVAALEAAGQDVADWEGKYFYLDIWINGTSPDVQVSSAGIYHSAWIMPDEKNTIMKHASKTAFAYFTTFFELTPTCRGYCENGHNPSVVVTPWAAGNSGTGKRDIAMTYYPADYFKKKAGIQDPRFYNLTAVYDQKDPKIVERQMKLIQRAGIGGAFFDIEEYWDAGTNTGTPSGTQKIMREYIKRIKLINDGSGTKLYAIPAYEDKANWLRRSYGNRPATVAAAIQDIDNWMDLFYNNPSFPGVGYRINGRPVLAFFNYEQNCDEDRGYSRLSSEELATWKADYISRTGDDPIIISNIRDTEHTAELEGNTPYANVLDGFFEWPILFNQDTPYKTPTPTGFVYYHELQAEKDLWELLDANARYRLNTDTRFVISGVWFGFDDKAVDGWGVGRRGIQMFDGTEALFDYQYQRAKDNDRPVIVIASFNDSAEGTNLEPSVEYSEIFKSAPGVVCPMLWPLEVTRHWLADIQGVPENTFDLWKPYYILSKKINEWFYYPPRDDF